MLARGVVSGQKFEQITLTPGRRVGGQGKDYMFCPLPPKWRGFFAKKIGPLLGFSPSAHIAVNGAEYEKNSFVYEEKRGWGVIRYILPLSNTSHDGLPPVHCNLFPKKCTNVIC